MRNEIDKNKTSMNIQLKLILLLSKNCFTIQSIITAKNFFKWLI